MIIPQKHTAQWLSELRTVCEVSREERISRYQRALSYYHTGGNGRRDSAYNRTRLHIDRLASNLYAPGTVRYAIEYDATDGPEWLKRAEIAGRYLSREYERQGLDMVMAQAVRRSLIKGCAFVKHLWGHRSVDGWLIEPEMMGVYREDVESLEQQEAFVHSLWITDSQFEILIRDHPDKEALLASTRQAPIEEDESSTFHEIILGGLTPVSTQPTTGKGIVNLMPSAKLSPEVEVRLLRYDEFWIQDDDRDDYTTFSMVGDVLIEGRFKRRNLSGIKGVQPFVKVCSNPTPGYLWGMSDVEVVAPIQDMLSNRMADIKRILDVQSKPPKAFIGFSGITQEKYQALMKRGGFISEQSPNAKIEDLAPTLPPAIFTEIQEMSGLFDELGGFKPITQGAGEPGVRAGSHAQTLLRTASPALRERALLIERQVESSGDTAFQLLQAHVARPFKSDKETFLLNQLPEDYRITVDSHSASPAFQDDARELAFAMGKMGWISPERGIELIHPPREDILIADAKAKQAAEAAMIKADPQLLQRKKA